MQLSGDRGRFVSPAVDWEVSPSTLGRRIDIVTDDTNLYEVKVWKAPPPKPW